jgi:hypothetical protein
VTLTFFISKLDMALSIKTLLKIGTIIVVLWVLLFGLPVNEERPAEKVPSPEVKARILI